MGILSRTSVSKNRSGRNDSGSGKKAFIRVDFNVPFNESDKITDNSRIVAALPTIQHVLLHGGSCILATHLGRPKGADLKLSLKKIIPELEKLLKKSRQNNPRKQPLVITESLFSMEGTTAPIKEISKLCIQYDSKLLIDEAHAFGVMGSAGRGESFELKEPISIISGTFGKAFGSGGAFLATDKITGKNLIQNCGAFRYTTALAPPLCASALAALNLIESNPNWGSELKEKSKALRDRLSQVGWQRPAGEGPIISIILGSDRLAMDYQKRLEAQGLLTVAIRPPTVPEGKSRLRLVIRRNTPDQAFERLIEILKNK